MAFKMNEEELYITQFKVEGTAERAHHMLLYGCSDVPVDNGAWYVKSIKSKLMELVLKSHCY